VVHPASRNLGFGGEPPSNFGKPAKRHPWICLLVALDLARSAPQPTSIGARRRKVLHHADLVVTVEGPGGPETPKLRGVPVCSTSGLPAVANGSP
jgi:hypothetical protein